MTQSRRIRFVRWCWPLGPDQQLLAQTRVNIQAGTVQSASKGHKSVKGVHSKNS